VPFAFRPPFWQHPWSVPAAGAPEGQGLSIDTSILSVGFREHDLCTRCGTCGAVCPTLAVSAGRNGFPLLDESKCISCGLCGKTCPGSRVSFPELSCSAFGNAGSAADFLGHASRFLAVHSTDTEVRAGAASGGAVTELLLFMLETGRIDGAVVTGMDPTDPTRAMTFIARTREQILRARQSRYIISPVNQALRGIRKTQDRLACVCLPCQVHGIRKWMAAEPAIRDRIACIIGLFCVTTLDSPVIRELLAARGISPESVDEIRFREGGWPGRICAFMKDGAVVPLHHSNFKDGAINYLTRLYSPVRCRMCPDGTAEFADISVGDAWMRGREGYTHPAMSVVLVRTQAGAKLVDDAVEAGRIVAHEVPAEAVRRAFMTFEKNKKKSAVLRAARRARSGKPAVGLEGDFPECGITDRLRERGASLVHLLGAAPRVRVALLRMLLSGFMAPLVALRRRLKRAPAE